MILTATISWVCWCRAWYTVPMPPSPTLRSRSYSPIARGGVLDFFVAMSGDSTSVWPRMLSKHTAPKPGRSEGMAEVVASNRHASGRLPETSRLGGFGIATRGGVAAWGRHRPDRFPGQLSTHPGGGGRGAGAQGKGN